MALRKTQNVITHIALSGDGQAHNANQVAFDNTPTDLDATNLQAALEELAARVAALEA